MITSEIVFTDSANYYEHCPYLMATPSWQGPMFGPLSIHITCLEYFSPTAVCHSSPSCYFYSPLLKMILCHSNSHYSNTFINIYGKFWDRKEGVKWEGGQWRLSTPTSLVREIILNSNHLGNTDTERNTQSLLIGRRPHFPDTCLNCTTKLVTVG